MHAQNLAAKMVIPTPGKDPFKGTEREPNFCVLDCDRFLFVASRLVDAIQFRNGRGSGTVCGIVFGDLIEKIDNDTDFDAEPDIIPFPHHAPLKLHRPSRRAVKVM